jgi:hypothetical protein
MSAVNRVWEFTDPCQNMFASRSPIHVPDPSLRSKFYGAKPNMGVSESFAGLLSDAGINQWEHGITKDRLAILKTAEGVLQSISFDNHDGMRANIYAFIALMYDNTAISSRNEGEKRRQEPSRLCSYSSEQSHQVLINDETLLFNVRMDYVISLPLHLLLLYLLPSLLIITPLLPASLHLLLLASSGRSYGLSALIKHHTLTLHPQTLHATLHPPSLTFNPTLIHRVRSESHPKPRSLFPGNSRSWQFKMPRFTAHRRESCGRRRDFSCT